MNKLHVICDLQFGSTGKGLFAGYLARKLEPDTLISAWGPNAGHTFVDADGTKYVRTMIPNGTIAPSVKRVLIGPGSVVDPEAMANEWIAGADKGRAELMIHEAAAVVTQAHRDREATYGFRIGSTMKGVGEAIMDKISRKAGGISNVAKHALRDTPLSYYVVSVEEYNRALNESECAILEGAQGFSLSMNQGFYPYTTSRDCTVHQLLSDCSIPALRGRVHVYGVARTYPIRVANRFVKCTFCDGTGINGGKPCLRCDGSTGKVKVGTSGPGYPDQDEIDWSKIGQEPELTTVTKLPRRLFTFSMQQIEDAVRMNRVHYIFLNFCNYMHHDDDLEILIKAIGRYAPVRWTGWGPKVTDIREIL